MPRQTRRGPLRTLLLPGCGSLAMMAGHTSTTLLRASRKTMGRRKRRRRSVTVIVDGMRYPAVYLPRDSAGAMLIATILPDRYMLKLVTTRRQQSSQPRRGRSPLRGSRNRRRSGSVSNRACSLMYISTYSHDHTYPTTQPTLSPRSFLLVAVFRWWTEGGSIEGPRQRLLNLAFNVLSGEFEVELDKDPNM